MTASCHGCPRRWTSLAEAHCPSCHEHFATVSGFDLHRKGGQCVDPASLLDRQGRPRLVGTERKAGAVWVKRCDRITEGEGGRDVAVVA